MATMIKTTILCSCDVGTVPLQDYYALVYVQYYNYFIPTNSM